MRMKFTLTGGSLALLTTTVLAYPPQLVDPGPGQVFLTPQIDLDLGPVPLVVPERFAQTALAERELMVPPGFAVNVFAAGAPLEGPRFMAWDPDGVLHVAKMMAGGGSEFSPPVNSDTPPAEDRMTAQVLALPDSNGDGVADEIIVAADRLWFPNSIQFYNGALYVADMHQILKLTDGDGDGYYEGREVVIPDLPIGHHRTRTIEFDRVRDKLYLSIGSSCDLCRETDPRRATIMEFDHDGSGGRIYAGGLRNAVGLGIHPLTNELWITTNGHDREGLHLPPEMVTVVHDGGFYGWPLAFGFRSWVDFRISAYEEAIFPITAQDSADVERVPRPVAMLPAHLAPMDVHFYQGDRFPPLYRNAAFVAFRGGSNAGAMGHKVVALFADPHGGNARVGDFLTGFQPTLSSNGGVWGEPAGLATDVRGALYVSSDWSNHMILRVVPSPLRGIWEQGLTDEVIAAFAGDRMQLRETIRVEGLEPGTDPPEVVADLSAFGGPAAVPLKPAGAGVFRLEQPLDLGWENGLRTLLVHISQQVGGVVWQTRLLRVFELRPGRDLVVVGEELAPGWRLTAEAPLGHAGFAEGPEAYRGRAAAFVAEEVSFRGWNLLIEPPAPVETLGYGSLRLAFHPGNTVESALPRLTLTVKPGRIYDLLGEGGIDLGRMEWQEVAIPLAALELAGPIEDIRIQGSLEGHFSLDEVRLETLTPRPAETAVAAEAGRPRDFGLKQNYPNPFNSATVISYAVVEAAGVELSVYNLAGQRVARLVRGFAGPGAYRVLWGGRNDAGQSLASGMYIYRLRSGNRSEARKLLLLR